MKSNLKHSIYIVLLGVLFTANLYGQDSQLYTQETTSLAEKSNSGTNETFEKEIDIPFFQGNRIYWYDSLKMVRESLSLENLEKSQTPHHIRIWTDKNAIDAWKDESGKYHCVITSFCKAYDIKKAIEGDFSLKSNRVETITAQVLIDSVYSMNIDELKDYHHIKKCNQNLIDGITYKMEISTPTSYRMFTFLNPENQSRNIEEVKLFLSFLNVMNKEFDLNYLHRQFMMGLKNGTYVAGLEVITKKKGSTRFSFR